MAGLSVQLAPETLALAAEIESRPPEPSRPGVGHLGSVGHATLDLPLVGRSEELGALVGEYYAVTGRGGGARAVALVGETGIGKTRLANEFVGWARGQGADVLEGRAFEAAGRLPYHALVSALRDRLERERAPDDLVSDVWLAELSRLLPEIRDRYPDLPGSSGEALEQTHLFEAVVRLLSALASRSPAVLFLDDLQWASVAGLHLLRYAGRRWTEEGTPILLVLGLRAEDLASNLELAAWLSDLPRDLPVRRLDLDTLRVEDTVEIVGSLAATGDHQADGATRAAGEIERVGRWLHDETGGQPFFLSQTLNALLEEDVLSIRRGVDGTLALDVEARDVERLKGILPYGVREVIRLRLGRLGRRASELLAAGAVLGERFGFVQLLSVAGIGEEKALQALDKLVRSRLLREAEDGRDVSGGTYAFAHDKIRDVVYTEAGDARRLVFHRRALEVLEREGAPPAVLARHASVVGLSEAALRYSLAAGDAAMALPAVQDAIDHYGRARTLFEGLASAGSTGFSVSELQRLYVNLGRAYELVGLWEEAMESYQTLLGRARDLRNPALEAATLNRLALLTLQRSFGLETATSLLEEALAVARASGEREASAETEWNLAQTAVHARNSEAALAHAERALRSAREIGRPDLVARSLHAVAFAHVRLGRGKKAEGLAEEARALFARLGEAPAEQTLVPAPIVTTGPAPSRPFSDRAMEAESLRVLAMAKMNAGRAREGVEAAREAMAIGREIDNLWVRASVVGPLVRALLDVGEYEEALDVSTRGVAEARNLGHPWTLLMALSSLGSADDALFRIEEGLAVHSEASKINEAIESRPYTELVASKLCANRVLAGDREAAHRHALEALKARRYDELPIMESTRPYETEALLWAGDTEKAREDVRRFGERVGGEKSWRRISYLRSLALLHRWEGGTEEAGRALREAAALAKEMNLLGELWRAEAELAQTYRALGDLDKERAALSRAIDTLRGLADKVHAPGLRNGFLGSSQVRTILGFGEGLDRRI